MKPSVLLEFELADVTFMRPTTMATSARVGGTAIMDTLVIRDKAWGGSPSVAIYIVMAGTTVVPISIPDNTTVRLEVIE